MSAKAEKLLMDSLAANFVNAVNIFRKVHNTTPLIQNSILQNKAKEIGSNIYVKRDFSGEGLALPKNIGCIIEKIDGIFLIQ